MSDKQGDWTLLSRVGMDGMVPDWRGEVPRRLMAKDLIDGSTHVISAVLIWALLGILYVDVGRIMFFCFFLASTLTGSLIFEGWISTFDMSVWTCIYMYIYMYIHRNCPIVI